MNDFFMKVRFTEIKLEEINSTKFYSNDIYMNKEGVSYVIKAVIDAENKLEVAMFPEKKGLPNVFTVDLNFEEEVSKIALLFRNLNKEHNDLVDSFFTEKEYLLVDCIKSKAENYKIFDVIINDQDRSWIVNQADKEKNILKLIRFPFGVKSEMDMATVDLNEEKYINKVQKIYR